MTVARYGGVASGVQPADPAAIEDMIDIAVEAFGVVADDPERCRRMADARTTCALQVTGLGADVGITALLDRTPIEVVDTVLPQADARISGPADVWLQVARKGNLGIAVARGELAFEGPVREFLRVFPIVRSAYAQIARSRREVATDRASA